MDLTESYPAWLSPEKGELLRENGFLYERQHGAFVSDRLKKVMAAAPVRETPLPALREFIARKSPDTVDTLNSSLSSEQRELAQADRLLALLRELGWASETGRAKRRAG